MKLNRSDVLDPVRKMPRVEFGDQSLTSFAGLVLFGEFFMQMGLRGRLGDCLGHLVGGQS